MRSINTGSSGRSSPSDPLDEGVPPVSAILQDLPEPPPGSEARVRSRLASRRPETSKQPWVLAGSLALSAALVAFAINLGPWADGGARLVPEVLTGQGSEQLNADVTVAYRGEGDVAGEGKAVHIDWSRGHLEVSVTPKQGAEVVVQTPDATVKVIGTVFLVDKGRLGTRVEVQRGHVEVTCTGEVPTQLVPSGEPLLCMPGTAPGLLDRAHALRESKAPSLEVLESINRGLGLSAGTGAIADELHILKVWTLAEGGDHGGALTHALPWLGETTSGRREEVWTSLLPLAVRLGRCNELAGTLREGDVTLRNRFEGVCP